MEWLPEDGRGGRGSLAISSLPDPPSSTFFLRTDDESRMKNPAKEAAGWRKNYCLERLTFEALG